MTVNTLIRAVDSQQAPFTLVNIHEHHGDLTQHQYLQCMRKSVAVGGLWGDGAIVEWVAQSLQCRILLYTEAACNLVADHDHRHGAHQVPTMQHACTVMLELAGVYGDLRTLTGIAPLHEAADHT